MIMDAANKVASLAKKITELPLGKPSFLPKERYTAKDFDLKNFRPIESIDGQIQGTQDSGLKTVKLAFLDGGNLALIDAPSFSVHFERVYANCFEGDKRVALKTPSKIEFFAVATSSGTVSDTVDNLDYKITFVPLNQEHRKYLPDEKDLVFDSYDESMRVGFERMEISRMGDIARSFAEWNCARFICEGLDSGDIFVRDGTLHAPYSNQARYADRAYDTARKRGVLFCGVSKTSQLYTTTGLPLVAAIGRLARENKIKAPGYYENVVDITDPAHKADLSFARFHARSDHTFRVEILKGQEEHKDAIMSALAENSRDISFPGYPYGLVDADKNARVSYDELEALRMLLFLQISKTGKFEVFKDFLSSGNAHDWLNRIV